jgi:DNA-binding transcriptional ArsR family regulator
LHQRRLEGGPLSSEGGGKVSEVGEPGTGHLGIEVAMLLHDPDLIPLTEERLAEAIRRLVKTMPFPALALAIIKALEDPEAEVRLKLVQGRRGAPKAASDLGTAIRVAKLVEDGLSTGVKQEALIADISREMDLGRSTVMNLLKKGREFLQSLPELRAAIAEAREDKNKFEP